MRIQLSTILLPLLLATSSAAAGEESPFGINVHLPQGPRLGYLLDRVAESGAGWVRIDFVWALIEPEPGVEEWRAYDELIAAARARGLNVLAIIAYTPAWATDGPPISGVPRRTADWSDFCLRAASRYRDSIRHWEVWNEPNLDRFWSGSRLEYVERILEPAARALRAGNPDALVGGPGLAHHVEEGRDWHGWLLDVLREVGGELDFLTHHAYDLDDPAGVFARFSGTTAHGNDPSRWHEAAPSLREVLALAGFDRPVWLTETGWVTTRLDESRQADQYERFLELWDAAQAPPARPARVFFYELEDDRDPDVPKYGLLRVSGRRKPAFQVLESFLTGEAPPPGEGDPRPGIPLFPNPQHVPPDD
jgi:hypothetical protein